MKVIPYSFTLRWDFKERNAVRKTMDDLILNYGCDKIRVEELYSRSGLVEFNKAK